MGRGTILRAATLWLLVITAPSNAPKDRAPDRWGGGGEGNYELTRDEAVKHSGKSSGSVASVGDGAGFGTLTQAFQASKYRGKRVRLRAFVKTEGVEGWAGLWMRVDGKEKTGLAFDNMGERPIKGTTDWTQYDVVIDVPDEADSIFFGFLVAGKGHGWVDDMTVEAVGMDVESTGRKIEPTDRQGEAPQGLPEELRNLDFET